MFLLGINQINSLRWLFIGEDDIRRNWIAAITQSTPNHTEYSFPPLGCFDGRLSVHQIALQHRKIFPFTRIGPSMKAFTRLGNTMTIITLNLH